MKRAPGRGAVAYQDWPDPEARDGDVIVEVRSAAICSTDVAIYDGSYVGRQPLITPCLMGHEAAGIVRSVTPGADDVRVGDHVALQVIWGHSHSEPVMRGFDNLDPDWFHLGTYTRPGAFADLIAIPADRVIVVPGSTTWEDAALLESLSVAVNALELCAIRAGDAVAIVGPGPFGLLMCQVAKASGATRVVVVGLHGRDEARLELARRVGADEALLFRESADEVVSAAKHVLGRDGADVCIDGGGTPESTWLALELAGPAGRVALFGFTKEARIQPLRQIIRKGLSLHGVAASQRRHYAFALRLLNAGLVRPREIVTHRFPFTDVVTGLELQMSRQAAKVILHPDGRHDD